MALGNQNNIRIAVIVHILKRYRCKLLYGLPQFSRIAVICLQLIRLVQNLSIIICDKNYQSVVLLVQCRIEPDLIHFVLRRILRQFLKRHGKYLILQQTKSVFLQLRDLLYTPKPGLIPDVLFRHRSCVHSGCSHGKRKGRNKRK